MTRSNQQLSVHIHVHQYPVNKSIGNDKFDSLEWIELEDFDGDTIKDLYEDTEVATDFQDIPPEEMNEVLEYYKKNYRHSIEVHFMDYKGRGLDTFSNEQYQARVREIEEALDRLPIPPTVHMYGFESHTAVWEIPEQRRFLTEEEFYRMRDNFLKMISTIGISTPIPTEDYYDSELAYYNQPMAELYKYYHEKIKPLAEFDRISGLRICAEDKK